MNLNNSDKDNEKAVQPEAALVKKPEELTAAMVVSVLESELKGAMVPLGVSKRWLTRLAHDFAFSRDELVTLLSIRTEFKGHLARVARLLDEGFALPDIYGCYRVQRELARRGEEEKRISSFVPPLER